MDLSQVVTIEKFMKKRLITGIFIGIIWIAVVVLALVLEGRVSLFFDLFVIMLSVVAALEMAWVLRQKFARPIEVLVVLAVILGFGAFITLQYVNGGASAHFAIPAFTIAVGLCVAAAFIWINVSKVKSTQHAITTTFVIVYPVSMLVFMLGLNYIYPLEARAAAIIMLFLAAPLTDVFAYLVGVTVKGPKLAPSISPKKTISGAVGGLAGGILAGLIVFLLAHTGVLGFLSLDRITSLDALHFIIMGLLASVATQGGDLLASMVKRRADVKDYGKLLPGHGGVMDRIDGMMLAAAVIYIYMLFLVQLA